MPAPPKGRADYYSDGDFNALCSMCGRKRKALTLEKNWMGLYRCPEHNESRQPQDFVRNVRDDTSVPWAQTSGAFSAGGQTTKPVPTYVRICTVNTQTAFPDIGLPNCMLPDNIHFDPYGL